MGLSIRVSAAAMMLATAQPGHMPASIFLKKADTLRSRGPFALFSSDLKLLQLEAETAGDELHVEHAAALAAGRSTDWCAPANKYLTPRELIVGMHAVPAAELAKMDIKQAMRAVFERNYPCDRKLVATSPSR